MMACFATLGTLTLLAMNTLWACSDGSEITDPDSSADPDGVPGDTSDVGDTTADTAPVPDCTDALEGASRCGPDGQLGTCRGGVWQYAQCPGLTRCESNQCVPIICAQGESRCLDTTIREVCSFTGTRFIQEACSGSCQGGQCVEGCLPGTQRCDGNDIVECQPDLSETLVQSCDPERSEQCLGGRCLDECALRGGKRGYIACDFWAADLPNDRTTFDNAFAFAFANDSERPAHVRVIFPWGSEQIVDVPVGGVAKHYLPLPRTLTQLELPGVAHLGLRIRSDQPISAFMFNPLERFDTPGTPRVTTADAAMLVPATSLGLRYRGITASDSGISSGPPFITVVAIQDGTEVMVTTTQTVTATDPPFIAREGVPTKVTLDAHDTLNLEVPSEEGIRRDLTGTAVESLNHPIAVFAGNRCARVPDDKGNCDHVETQLPPIEAWGDHFVVTKFTERGGESDTFKVLALEDFTEITIDPPRFTPLLLKGTTWEFQASEGFELRTSHPVMIGQLMAGATSTRAPGPFNVTAPCFSEGVPTTCLGDAALVVPAPIAQWREQLTFLVPDTYAYQFVNVAFDVTTSMRLDGVDVDASAARQIGSSGWRALAIPVTAGFHRLDASAPVGAIVYGYDLGIGYAYNAGLNFEPLWTTAPPGSR